MANKRRKVFTEPWSPVQTALPLSDIKLINQLMLDLDLTKSEVLRLVIHRGANDLLDETLAKLAKARLKS